jgi:hypothetical protein
VPPVLGRLIARIDAEASDDLGDVPLRAIEAYAEALSYLAVRVSAYQQIEHFALAGCPLRLADGPHW